MFDIAKIHRDDFVCVRLVTGDAFNGVVLNHGGDFVVVKEYNDFRFSGYLFIANAFIQDIQAVEPVEIIVKIVKSEKMLTADSEHTFLSALTSTNHLLQELEANNQFCIFHEDSEHLSIGRLFKVTEEHVFVQRVMTDFEYEDTFTRLNKSRISMIELGSEYLRIYRDYSDSSRVITRS